MLKYEGKKEKFVIFVNRDRPLERLIGKCKWERKQKMSEEKEEEKLGSRIRRRLSAN